MKWMIPAFPVMARLVLGGAILSLGTGLSAYAATVDIVIRDLAFVPAEAQAKVGDTIRWRNEDPAPHTVTAAGRFDIPVPVGESGETTINQPGPVDYHCTLHEGMQGRIVVSPR